LGEVKRSTGRRIVRLSVDGDHQLSWLASVSGVRVVRRGVERTEIEVEDGVEPDVILVAALAHGARVRHFEIAEPSLEEVFISHVGRPVAEDALLAPVSAGNAAGAQGSAA
jgi:ABC-type uncharacterized transport system ATPase subunit